MIYDICYSRNMNYYYICNSNSQLLCKNQGPDHFNAVDQISRYLAEKNIIFEGESKYNFIRYSDFDLAGDYINKKSISGFVFTLNK